MKFFKTAPFLAILLPFTIFYACKKHTPMAYDNTIVPPKADQILYQHKIHDDIRLDPYYWLKERDNPEVIDYLERENDYYQKMTAGQAQFKEDLFEEMKARIKEDDSSVPYFYRDYWYITRYEKGKQYPIYTRKKDSLTAAEEILIDCNELAKGHDYFRLVGLNISPDNKKVAYGVDIESRRKYTLYVKDLSTQKMLATQIENTTGGSTWAADSEHLFYMHKNPKTLRSEAIYRHHILAPKQENQLVYFEEDDTFSTYVVASKSEDYIFIGSQSTLTTEYQFIKASEPLSSFQMIQERKRGLEYDVQQFEDYFYILTNQNKSTNYELVRTPIQNPGQEHWETIIPHREEVLIEDVEIFKSFYVVTERTNGLSQLRIIRWDESEDFFIPVEGETYSLYSAYNPNFDTTKIRYRYSSLILPSSVYEFDVFSKTQELLKQQPVMDKTFDSGNYIEKRLWATGRDGTKIPVSIVYHKDTKPSAETPLLQYAYGSYGATIDPSFSSTRLSLLNRGFIYAIAHIRGGEYLGRQWYEEGKLLKKKNTFNDFIDVSKFLIEEHYTSADHLHAYGGSAGGLLMGVVVNEAPELYKSVVAAVPFVDVVTTMLDASIPLTTFEYDEWGNPNDAAYYAYMKSYSPYDNLKAQAYPNIYVTAGYHDSQVQYWEPAKWVAALRTLKTDDHVLFLDTNMVAGHSGNSGRFDALKETAKTYVFLLNFEGRVD